MTGRARLTVIIGAVVVVVAALVVGLVVLLVPKSPNAGACSDYAAGFNGLVDAVNLSNHGGGNSGFGAAQTRMQVMVARAAQEAHGKVAGKMLNSSELANQLGPNGDTNTAFFVSALDVKKACGADGAAVTFQTIH